MGTSIETVYLFKIGELYLVNTRNGDSLLTLQDIGDGNPLEHSLLRVSAEHTAYQWLQRLPVGFIVEAHTRTISVDMEVTLLSASDLQELTQVDYEAEDNKND